MINPTIRANLTKAIFNQESIQIGGGTFSSAELQELMYEIDRLEKLEAKFFRYRRNCEF